MKTFNIQKLVDCLVAHNVAIGFEKMLKGITPAGDTGLRLMRATMNVEYINTRLTLRGKPSATNGPEIKFTDYGTLLVVWDLDKDDWRSFYVERILTWDVI